MTRLLQTVKEMEEVFKKHKIPLVLKKKKIRYTVNEPSEMQM